MIYFTADCHFGHANIIKYCNRPFSHVQEMDESLINNWNNCVKPEDTIYIIGDFCFGNPSYYLSRLNGHKHLVVGSHDNECKKHMFESFRDITYLKERGFYFILCHTAFRIWEKAHHGSVHLFGHTHGKMKTSNLSFDVGVDTNSFFPYSIDKIISMVNIRKQDMLENKRIIIERGKDFYIQDDLDNDSHHLY